VLAIATRILLLSLITLSVALGISAISARGGVSHLIHAVTNLNQAFLCAFLGFWPVDTQKRTPV
jgi:hypothetical protein